MKQRKKTLVKRWADVMTPEERIAKILKNPDELPPYKIYEPEDYKDGPEGFIAWCEDNVRIPIYPEGSDVATWCSMGNLPMDLNPETGRSFRTIWEAQKDMCRQALRMVEGRFIYRLIVLCWPRGDGKSLLACLIQLWKFFNWPKQQIVLGANSKEQVTFVHFDIMKDIIMNSPKLIEIVGMKNIQDKKIRIVDKDGHLVSAIRAISSFSGIVSNITGYTFSEIFDMKNPRFFVQLDGSIRNIPNALGVIDSTVSSKQHILYNLFESFVGRKSKTLFFHYRCSREGKSSDYWNPNMTQTQLNDYRSKFPPQDFAQYFLNTWGAAAGRIFSEAVIEAIKYMGIDGLLGYHKGLIELVEEKVQKANTIKEYVGAGRNFDLVPQFKRQIKEMEERLIPVSKFYKLIDYRQDPVKASMDDLNLLGDRLDTNWAILGGIDRGDPMKKEGDKGARTVVTIVAKGLPGSKSRPFNYDHEAAPNYLYFLLHIEVIPDHGLEGIKDILASCHEEYDGIDSLCGERWGLFDMVDWCEDKNILLETTFPSYDKQRSAFTEFFMAVSTGRFKAPEVYIYGSKEMDIFREELGVFYHDKDKHWFGSPEKFENNGIQDDVIFSLGWTIYGGRSLTIESFRKRGKSVWFGTMVQSRTEQSKPIPIAMRR